MNKTRLERFAPRARKGFSVGDVGLRPAKAAMSVVTASIKRGSKAPPPKPEATACKAALTASASHRLTHLHAVLPKNPIPSQNGP